MRNAKLIPGEEFEMLKIQYQEYNIFYNVAFAEN